MIIRRKLPEAGELVIIKINKIMPYGAYCSVVEYNADAYLPISEIASGWIKNIHEFIKEGQKDVAKVIFVDKEKNAIDISLKKATATEKKKKMDEYNLEKRAEGMFGKALAAAGLENRREEIATKVAKYEQTYTDLIDDIFDNKDPLANLEEKQFKQALYELVFKTIKPKKYMVSYTVELTTLDTKSGVKLIKEALGNVENLGVQVLYLGAPHYRLSSEDLSYPKAEGRIKEAQKILEKYNKKLTYSMKSNKGATA
jgi:translation initiation factor 2 subunit 1